MMIRLWELLWHGCWHDWRYSTVRKLFNGEGQYVADEIIYVCKKCERVKTGRL